MKDLYRLPENVQVLCFSYDIAVVLDENNLIQVYKIRFPCYASNSDMLRDIVLSCGYKQFNFENTKDLLRKFEGESIEAFKDELRRRAKLNFAKREENQAKNEKWNECLEEFGGTILSIFDVDTYDTGFSVWVSLSSQRTYQQQIELIKAKKKDVVKYVGDLLRLKKRWKHRAELLPYCYVSGIVVTRRNALVIKYELKEEIQRVLN